MCSALFQRPLRPAGMRESSKQPTGGMLRPTRQYCGSVEANEERGGRSEEQKEESRRQLNCQRERCVRAPRVQCRPPNLKPYPRNRRAHAIKSIAKVFALICRRRPPLHPDSTRLHTVSEDPLVIPIRSAFLTYSSEPNIQFRPTTPARSSLEAH